MEFATEGLLSSSGVGASPLLSEACIALLHLDSRADVSSVPLPPSEAGRIVQTF